MFVLQAHSDAVHAIVGMNGQMLGGKPLKCSWGRHQSSRGALALLPCMHPPPSDLGAVSSIMPGVEGGSLHHWSPPAALAAVLAEPLMDGALNL